MKRSTLIFASLVASFTWGGPLARAATPSEQAPVFLNRTGWSGVGLNIGNLETGVTAKVWASPKVAVQGAVGERPEGNSVRLNVDLTYSPSEWRAPENKYALPFYVGVGGALGHSFASGERPASTEAGFRLPVGMSILVPDNPVELFFEIAPELTFRDSAALGRYTVYIDGAIGLRYYR
jgi:hypothetical protein